MGLLQVGLLVLLCGAVFRGHPAPFFPPERDTRGPHLQLGGPPYHAPGFAPIPACWGWLVVGILIGALGRELLGLALAVLWARAPSPPPPTPGGPSTAAAEVLRSWELGGDGEVQAIADRTELSATALLCKVLHATLRGRATGTLPGARAEVGRQPRKQPKGPKARP